MYKVQGSKEISQTHTHATLASAYQIAPGNLKKILITDIAVSSDKADSVVNVIQDKGGSMARVLFQSQVDDGNLQQSFQTPLQVEANLSVRVEVDGSSVCKANFNGLIVYSDISESSSCSSSSCSSSSCSSSCSSCSSSSSSYSSSCSSSCSSSYSSSCSSSCSSCSSSYSSSCSSSCSSSYSSSCSSSCSCSSSSSSSSLAPGWLGITSADLDSDCGDDGSPTTIEAALDGTNVWKHSTNETHWFIIDLGVERHVEKVKGRSGGDLSFDPTNVNIYVSNSKVAWGGAVKSGITTWQDTVAFIEVDLTTPKDGRYVKVEITTTEDVTHKLEFGGPAGNFFNIFDVFAHYGGWSSSSSSCSSCSCSSCSCSSSSCSSSFSSCSSSSCSSSFSSSSSCSCSSSFSSSSSSTST